VHEKPVSSKQSCKQAVYKQEMLFPEILSWAIQVLFSEVLKWMNFLLMCWNQNSELNMNLGFSANPPLNNRRYWSLSARISLHLLIVIPRLDCFCWSQGEVYST
jgi:hypothetical protein